MATSHTENYQLNLWEPEDSFLRTEFNENSAKIDAAIKEVRDKTDAAIKEVRSFAETGLNRKVELVFGSYVGDMTDPKTINLGFQPKGLLMINPAGELYFILPTFSFNTLKLTDQGFEAKNSNTSNSLSFNYKQTYHYIAIP